MAAREIGQNAFKGMGFGHWFAALTQIGECNLFAARTIQHHLLHIFWQLVPGRFRVESIMCRQALNHLVIQGVAAIPAADCARSQRNIGVGHHAQRVEKVFMAQAIAHRAGARRVVEREQARFQFGQAVVAHRAGKFAGKHGFSVRVQVHCDGFAIA